MDESGPAAFPAPVRASSAGSPRYLCIHGHFYQPPRENPWLEAIESQPSAYPYHDWNQRIAAECYAPNANSRILDEKNRIVAIVNNYASMSFNFGPTLLSWLEAHEPDVYRAILAADAQSRARFGGHGSALAQPYNHPILPLSNARDRRTQVLWGLADFTARFGRAPEGMWLPETAVNTETLEVLAEHGLRFTILSPHQATHVRPLSPGGGDWEPTRDGGVDPSRAYRCDLPSGRSIALFFYDGPVSRSVAFGQLLSKGELLAARLAEAFSSDRPWPQLVHVATDGETFGHHHRHGDRALAHVLHGLEAEGFARLTNYGEFLEREPPTHAVRILEDSSWSCAHGVERWRGDCGCQTGAHPGWNQAWRAPLREALDGLRDVLEPLYAQGASGLLSDPWAARDDYARVLLDRSSSSSEKTRFLRAHARPDRTLTEEETVTVWKLLELQRHAQLMYTSCGWFFDDVAGIEARQILQYAGRAVQLAREIFSVDLEPEFLGRLEKARSNVPDAGDGRRIYEETVREAVVSLARVGAHYGVSSLFREFDPTDAVYCYRVERLDFRLRSSGRARLALGRLRVVSEVTGESQRVAFGVLHMGGHNLLGGAFPDPGEEAYERIAARLTEPFEGADLPEALRLVDRIFGTGVYALKSLFRDERQRVLGVILQSVLKHADAAYRELYQEQMPLMRFLSGQGIAPPRGFRLSAELALHTELRRALDAPQPKASELSAVLGEARSVGIDLPDDGLALAAQRAVERLFEDLRGSPTDLVRLEALEGVVDLARSLPFEVDFWKVQNGYYAMLLQLLPERRREAAAGFEDAARWIEKFLVLGERLSVNVERAALGVAFPSSHSG